MANEKIMPRLFSTFLLLLALGFTQPTAACQCCCCCQHGLEDEFLGLLPLADEVLQPRRQGDDGALATLKEQKGETGKEDELPEKHLAGEAGHVTGTGKIGEKQMECNITEEVDEEGKTKKRTVTEKKVLTGDVDKTGAETSIGGTPLLDKGDEIKKVEREEKITETLKDNKTKEVVVKEKEEKPASGETIKETFVTVKNITDKGEAGTDVEKETVIEKEVEKEVCHNKRNLQVTKEEKLAGRSEKVAEKVFPSLEKKVVKSQEENVTKDGKIIRKEVPMVKRVGKIDEKVVPIVKEDGVAETGVLSVKGETIVEQVAPSTEQKIVPDVKEEEKVIEKTVTEKKVTQKDGSVIREEKVVEKVLPSVKEKDEKVVPDVKEEEIVVKKMVPIVKEIAGEEKVVEKVPVVEVLKVKSINGTVDSVLKEGEECNKTTVPATEKETVTEKKVTEKDGAVIKEEKTVEKAVPSVEEKVTSAVNFIEKVEPVEKEEKLLSGEAMKELSEESEKEPKKIERSEKITETLPDNKTKEFVLNEKEEKLSSGAVIKETSVTNVTDKGEAGKDVEKVTVFKIEVEKQVCPLVKEEYAVEKVAPMVKEEKVVPSVEERVVPVSKEEERVVGKIVPSVKEKHAGDTVVPSGKQETTVEKVVPSLKEEKVVEKVVPSVREEAILETTVPSEKEAILETMAPSVKKETIVKKVSPPVEEKIAPISKEEEKLIKKVVPVIKEEKVIETAVPFEKQETAAEKVTPSVKEKGVVEKVTPSVGEKVVPIVTKEEEVVQKAPVVREIEGKGKVTTEIPVTEVKEMVSPGNEKVVSVPQEGEKIMETVAPAVEKDIVTEKKVTRKDGSIITEEKIVEKLPSSVKEKEETIAPVPKEEERVLEKTEPVKEITTDDKVTEKVPVVNVTEKIIPSVQEKSVSVLKEEERVAETVAPAEKKEIVTEKKVIEKDGSIIREEKVLEKVSPTVEEKIISALKQEETAEKAAHDVKEELSRDEEEAEKLRKVLEKVLPSLKEESVIAPEGKETVGGNVPVVKSIKKEEGETEIPDQIKTKIITADAVKGDDRQGPFAIVKDTRQAKVENVVKSGGDKIVQVLPPTTEEEVVMEKITPVTKVGKKLIPRGATTVIKPQVFTPAEEKVAAAPQTPKAQKAAKKVIKVVKAVPVVKRGNQAIKTLPPIMQEEVVSDKVVPAGEE